jgi:hypothetical protein
MHGGIVVRIENQTGKLLRVPLVIDKVGGAEDSLERIASLDAYAPETHPVGVDDDWAETHAIGEIPAGEYRVSFSYAGQYWERFAKVHPDKVTTIYFLIEE